MNTGTAAAGTGVLTALILWWWTAAPILYEGGWPEMTAVDAGAHAAALWWIGQQALSRWRVRMGVKPDAEDHEG